MAYLVISSSIIVQNNYSHLSSANFMVKRKSLIVHVIFQLDHELPPLPPPLSYYSSVPFSQARDFLTEFYKGFFWVYEIYLLTVSFVWVLPHPFFSNFWSIDHLSSSVKTKQQ